MRVLIRTLLFFIPAFLTAQPNRIQKPVDPTRTVALKTRLNPQAEAAADQGPVDAAFPIDYATLYLKPTPSQQAALEKLLADQQDPASPDYHRWLTPETFADHFGLSRADLAKITAWLTSRGIRVNDVARGRRWITFSGTASAVGRAFHTSFHRYQSDGETHFANNSVPAIPEALSGIVSEIGGFDDYDLSPASGKRPHNFGPDYNNGAGTHFLAPDDLSTIYDLKPLYAAGIDGTGVKIAVIGASAIDMADIRAFRSRFNLPAKDPQLMLVGPDPGTVAADLSEANLDLEWSGAVARNADIIFVYARSTTTAAQYAVDQRVAPIITESFGGCEQGTTTVLQAIAQQANSEGITWVASTGDVGAAGCERQQKLLSASRGLAVQSPASIPEITGVGGTEFDEGATTYWANANDANGASAMSYIPEKVWNDTPGYGYLASSTGGSSIFYPKPWWQTGPGVPSDNTRHVPDIALSASWNHDGFYTVTQGSAVSSGGTSAAAPSFAGFLALLNQYLISQGTISQPGLGNVNPNLYRIAQSAPATFHDIVNGDNIVPCVQGSPDCVNGSFGYSAGPGYDLATGLGSIDAFKLATNWTIGTPTKTSVAASPSNLAFNSGKITLTATVTSTGAAPSGDVTFVVNDISLGSATLSGGTATLTLTTLQLPIGASTINAFYSGAAGLNGSAATTTVTVTAPSGASAVVPTVTPNPVYEQFPNASGFSWFTTVRLTNESSTPTTLTKFIDAGFDDTSNIKAFFGTDTIPANGSIAANISWKGIHAPTTLLYTFSGTDPNGTTWSQSLNVPFLTRVLQTTSLLIITPSTVFADPSADPSCRWTQPVILEEQGGYDLQLTSLTSGSTDFSSQLQNIFGTKTIAPYGRLRGSLCWSSSTAAGSKTISLGAWLSDFDSTNTRTFSATTSLSANPVAGITGTAAPAEINLSSATPTATVSLNFDGGNTPWTARVSPNNDVTTWLKVSPASGTGPAQLTLTASPAGLSHGVYNATFLITPASGLPQYITAPVSFTVGESSSISIGGISNAASYKTSFAPGELISVFGTGLSTGTEHAPLVPLPLSMQGVTATVNGYPAPLLDVSPGQLNVQIPYETGAGPAILGVNNNGQVASFSFTVKPNAPAIFMTLDGAGKLVPFSSGKRGDILLAFITGEGAVSPVVYTGRTPTTGVIANLPAPAAPISITVGGVPANIQFAGIPRGLVGVTQINFTVPPTAPLGNQPVVVTVGGVPSAPVILTVQ